MMLKIPATTQYMQVIDLIF
ncbi:unnamed protein product, partial [Tilletia caries]